VPEDLDARRFRELEDLGQIVGLVNPISGEISWQCDVVLP
jgi:hypothetical protein